MLKLYTVYYFMSEWGQKQWAEEHGRKGAAHETGIYDPDMAILRGFLVGFSLAQIHPTPEGQPRIHCC